jgi:hypothetical protein
MFNNELSSTLRNTAITTSYTEKHLVGFDSPLKTTTTLTTALLLT